MDLSKYPIQKLLFVVGSIVPGCAALLIYWARVPHGFDWFFSLSSLGYRTKLAVVLLCALLIGSTLTRFVAGLIGAIEGGLGGWLYKPAHSVEVAPWRDATWRATVSKVLHDPPKDTKLWPRWLYGNKLQAIQSLPEHEQPAAKVQLELDRLQNEAEDRDWFRWYQHYHNIVLFPKEKDLIVEIQRGIHFNLQVAGVYVLVSALFVARIRVWWCIAPAAFWFLMLVVEEWTAARNALNFWSTLDTQITYLSELGRSSPASQTSIPLHSNRPSPV